MCKHSENLLSKPSLAPLHVLLALAQYHALSVHTQIYNQC